MSDDEQTDADENVPNEERDDRFDLEEIAQLFSLVVNNTIHHHWFSDRDRDDTIDACFECLNTALEAEPELSFRLAGTTLTINDRSIANVSPQMDAWIEQLDALEIANFSLQRGLERKSFNGLLEVLTARREELDQLGGFTTALTACGVRNVSHRTVVFREITDQETVVERDALKGLGEGDALEVGGILAFLRGEGEGSAFSAEDLEKSAPDSRQLAELILQAAEVQDRVANVSEGEALGDIVVGCVRRMHDAMSKTREAQTQRGKKKVSRDLMLIEQELMKQLRELSAEAAESVEVEVSDAVQEIQEQVRMDALATDYARKRKALHASEEEIKRYVERKGVDELDDTEFADRLSEAGLPLTSWRQLAAGDGAAAGPGGGGGGAGADVAHLADLLERMDSIVGRLDQGAPTSPDEFADVLQDLNSGVDAAVKSTQLKIKRVADDVQADEAAARLADDQAHQEGIGLRLSRRKLLELLAEIVQELFQPLAVVNSAVDMLAGGHLGETSDTQKQMLTLTQESAGKLQSLMNGLLQITGVPEELSPDHEMLEDFGRPADSP